MRASRVVRLLIRIFIGLLALSVTIISFLGGLSAVIILTNQDNIGIDTANADFNLDYDLGGLHDANFTLPFNITNSGYFDIENFQLRLELAMNYSHVDYPTPGVNGTRTVKIFEKVQPFGTIPKGLVRAFNFTGLFSDFLPGNFPNMTDIDLFKPLPLIEFYANFTISLDYSLGMHSVSINVRNIQAGEWP
ncbi:MAG: hypothetical protein ACXAC5_24070 [Promethearchaeota archaeon]|jgi:hypothetical protein